MLIKVMVRSLLGLLILGAACAADAAQPSAGDPAPAPVEMAPHAAASLGIRPDGCQALWNADPVTPDEILARSVAMLEQAIDRIGGPQYATEENIPYLSLDAPPEASWECMGPSLHTVQRSGMIKLELRGAFVFFAMNAFGPAADRADFVAVGANGRLAWNGVETDLDGLRAHVRALGDDASVPDRLLLEVAPQATFLDLSRAADAIGDEGGRATLTGCGGPIGPYRPDRPACPREPHEPDRSDR